MKAALILLVILYCVHGKVYSPDDMVGVPENICDYFASDKDMTNVGIIGAVSTYCQQQLGVKPDQVHVNVDSEPYKMCLAAGPATFGNLQPNTGQSIIAKDFFNNTSDQTVTHDFSLTGTFSESISVSTTNTVTLSTTVEYGVSIPDIFTSKFTISTSFSSSQTSSRTATNSISYTPHTSAQCAPHCAYTAVATVNTAIYKSSMSVPLCLVGYARCQYNSRVKDHYYWYVQVEDFVQPNNRCFHQSGSLSSIVSDIDAKTTFSKTCYK